jgi:hypothetical protein
MNTKKLNVVKVYDQKGWAFFWICEEMKRYSKHNIIPQQYNAIDYSEIDIILISSPEIAGQLTQEIIPTEARKRKIKFVGMYSGESKFRYNFADLIISISLKHLPILKTMYPNIPVIYLPEAIDSEYFMSDKKWNKKYTVGWCGRPSNVKRPHILDKLDFPIVRKQNWGKEYFVNTATLDHVKNFYNNINTLILTSESECMPRVILEAMSMSLPVISTEVGSLRLVINPQWLVPINPEQTVIDEINAKLDILSKYPKLRNFVGKENRKIIEDNFSWKIVQPLWDNIFDALMRNDYNTIETLANNWLTPYLEKNPDLLSTNPETLSKAQFINGLCDYCKKSSIKLIAIQKTCLNIMQSQKIKEDLTLLTFCVTKTDDFKGVQDYLIKEGWAIIEGSLFKKNNLSLMLTQQNPGSIKQAPVYESYIYVPMPVIPYLENMFGSDWGKLDK